MSRKVLLLLCLGTMGAAALLVAGLGAWLLLTNRGRVFVRELACRNGSASSCYKVGLEYLSGDKIARNESKGIELLDQGCSLNNSSACQRLLEIHLFGDGLRHDRQSAVDFLESACEGSASLEYYRMSVRTLACRRLGQISAHGDGVPKNLDRAARFYYSGCELDDKTGADRLRQRLSFFNDSVRPPPPPPPPPPPAPVPFSRARHTRPRFYHYVENPMQAMNCHDLGRLYETGSGVAKDEGKTRRCYAIACAGWWNNPITLAIQEQGYVINDYPLTSLEDLSERLKDIYLARADKTIFVALSDATGQRVDNRQLRKLFEAVRGAGVERVFMVDSMSEYIEAVIDACRRSEREWKALEILRATEIPEIQPDEDLDLGIEGGVVGGVEGGIVGGVVGGLDDVPPEVQPVRVGGSVKEPRLLKKVAPDYPPVARAARVQGVVILECVISPQGKVTRVKVLRGIPLLNNAAITAVKQWVYAPTLLHGVPVPVTMHVTVNFKLQ